MRGVCAQSKEGGGPEGERQAERAAMVADQLVARDIGDRRVLAVMAAVPRHRFVPAGLLDLAYADGPLPIGYGQTISQPYIVALMTELVVPGAADRVLEVGTGCGYQTAVLARLVAAVCTIEIVPQLAQRAQATLGELGVANVECRVADGCRGWPERAPFDGIVVTAAPLDVSRHGWISWPMGGGWWSRSADATSNGCIASPSGEPWCVTSG
jgi:protein-L-isoaspartate(D-aspartate) O-methyltransferase